MWDMGTEVGFLLDIKEEILTVEDEKWWNEKKNIRTKYMQLLFRLDDGVPDKLLVSAFQQIIDFL